MSAAPFAESRAETLLRSEYLAALRQDPRRPIATPDFANIRTPAFDVFFELIAGEGSEADDAKVQLLQIVVEAASAGHPVAEALIAKSVAEHAAWHRDELIIQMQAAA